MTKTIFSVLSCKNTYKKEYAQFYGMLQEMFLYRSKTGYGVVYDENTLALAEQSGCVELLAKIELVDVETRKAVETRLIVQTKLPIESEIENFSRCVFDIGTIDRPKEDFKGSYDDPYIAVCSCKGKYFVLHNEASILEAEQNGYIEILNKEVLVTSPTSQISVTENRFSIRILDTWKNGAGVAIRQWYW